MNTENLLNRLKNDSRLYSSMIHGIGHWRTVERNGLYLSEFSRADTEVVIWFAYLHDCMRENDNIDKMHGSRGAEYVKANRDLLGLDDARLDLLCEACAGHTNIKIHADVTVQTCWDADRLDIGRVGITPNSEFLQTKEAKRIADENDFRVLYQYSV